MNGAEGFRLGQRLSEPVYGCPNGAARPVLLMAAGQTIESLGQLLVLREAGLKVHLPQESVAEAGAAAATRSPSSGAQHTPARADVAERLRRSVVDAAGSLHARIRDGGKPDVGRLLEESTALAEQIAADPRVAVTTTFLSRCDDYTIEHSADVSILMVAIASQMGFPEEEFPQIALAGLVHDIGKQRVPLEILNKPGRLTAEEFAVIKQHPATGYDILRECPECPEAARQVTIQHHERLDGSGYPYRARREALHPYSLISAVADCFDAMTADRVYRKALPSRDALLELYRGQGQAFDPQAVTALIHLTGVYPVGTRVVLSTGERGAVVQANPGDPVRPVVEVDRDRFNRPLRLAYQLMLEGSPCWIAGIDGGGSSQ